MNVPGKPSRPALAPPLQVIPQRLNSWKEIASYFDRDVRTVQLWEKKEGLPVHRHEHDARSSVYAVPSELEHWFNQRRKKTPGASSELHAVSPTDAEVQALPVAPATRSIATQSPLRRLWLVIAALAVGSLATLLGLRLHRSSHPTPATRAGSPAALSPPVVLAVLPFQEVSPATSRTLWVDGFTDDLITELGRNSSLQVISRRSTMPLKGSPEPLASIASRLHASFLLEGTVAHDKGETRINVQLIDAAHDRELWSERYTRKTGDILSIQDEIASSITAAVTGKITGQAPPVDLAHTSPRTVDAKVRLDYLTGNYFLNQRDEPGLLQAIDYFHRAIARDPKYVPAYAGLADCYNLLSVWGRFTSKQGFPRSREAALTALRLDPNSAEAYTALAFETFRYEWNFPQAEVYFRKAIELNPNYAPAHHWYGQYLVDLRRFAPGLVELRKARELDPLSPIMASDYADACIYARRYDEAIAELKQVVQLYPNFIPAQSYLVSAYSDAGDLDAANSQAETYLQISGDDGPLHTVHLKRLVLEGKLAQARTEALPLLKKKVHLPVATADIYFGLGESEQGYAALERAIQQRDWWLVTVLDDDSFDSIRSEPRFLAIERRIGLPTDRD
jgi:TolB-like protein/tetratricopeptide (TPR) repeat protein